MCRGSGGYPRRWHRLIYLVIIMEHRLYYWKISCIIGRQIVVLEDQLYYWKSTVLLEDLLRCWKMNGRSKVLLENQLYWRQSTGLDGNYRSRKITARRWLHKYVGAECGASSFTWYLYQMCNTDVRPSVRPRFPDFSSTCFEISIWNLSCITIGSFWPSLQPKVGQTHFLQSWPHKSR